MFACCRAPKEQSVDHLPAIRLSKQKSDATNKSDTLSCVCQMADALPRDDEQNATVAMKKLKEGNAMFLQSNTSIDYLLQISKRTTPLWRDNLIGGQAPQATIVCCSDSRVAPELIFNAGLGQLFVVRNAGNTWDSAVLATVNYGIVHLGTPICIVLGHEKCGAITAALDTYSATTAAPDGGDTSPAAAKVNGKDHAPTEMTTDEHMATWMGKLVPAVEAAVKVSGDTWKTDEGIKAKVHQRAVVGNTENTARALLRLLPDVRAKKEKGELTMYVACYSLSSGKVNIIKEA